MATFIGTADADSLFGGVEDDLLQGLEGADTLDGATGVDTLEGGLDDDTYIVGDREDVVVEAAEAGVDTIVWMGAGGYGLSDNIENGVAGGRFSGVLFGNALDNDLTGWGDESNWLQGADGNDTLRGGGWDDDLEGGAGNDLLIGQNDLSDLPGTIDPDVLDGGEGADTMIGGDGYDIYWAEDPNDVLIEDVPPEGADEITAYYYSQDSVNWTGTGVYTLADNVEYLYLRDGGVEGLGNDQANVLWSLYGSFTFGEPIGNADVTLDGAGGDDVILGGSGGNDVLFGGDGSDRIEGADLSDTLHGGSGDDEMYGESTNLFSQSDDTLFGDEGDDILDGGNGDDSLDGGDGIDVFFGGYGDDTMTGGAGADRFGGMPGNEIVTDFTDGEDLILGDISLYTIAQDGADTLITYPGEFGFDNGTIRLIGIDSTLVTEDDFLAPLSGDEFSNYITGNGDDELILAREGDDQINAAGGGDGVVGGVGEDTMWGGAGADTLNGGLGDDTMDGGAGRDMMSGGSGDDTFIITDAKDIVQETEGGGIDTVETNISYQLGEGVENLTLGDAASAMAIRSFDELGAPFASAGDRLDGTGNTLANTIIGSSGANALSGLGGADSLYGGGGKDTLNGDGADDILKGGGRADQLAGGTGDDRLSGGSAADVFIFSGASGDDRITDFSSADGDRIRIDSAAATRFGDLAISSDGRGGAIVAWDGNSITLANIAPESLRARDFSFAQSASPAPISAFADDALPADDLALSGFHGFAAVRIEIAAPGFDIA